MPCLFRQLFAIHMPCLLTCIYITCPIKRPQRLIRYCCKMLYWTKLCVHICTETSIVSPPPKNCLGGACKFNWGPCPELIAEFASQISIARFFSPLHMPCLHPHLFPLLHRPTMRLIALIRS